MKKAAEAHTIGITPDEAIDETVAAGWQGINLDWLQNRLTPRQQQRSAHAKALQKTPTTTREHNSDFFAGCEAFAIENANGEKH